MGFRESIYARNNTVWDGMDGNFRLMLRWVGLSRSMVLTLDIGILNSKTGKLPLYKTFRFNGSPFSSKVL